MCRCTIPSLVMLAALPVFAHAAEPRVTGVAGARFRVADLAKARAFYTEVFGLQEKPGSDPATVTFQINAEQWVEFSVAKSGASGDPLQRLILATRDRTGGVLVDPDGHTVELAPRDANALRFKPGVRSLSDHLLHIGLGTTDLERGAAFYTSQLGCQEIWRGPTPQETRIIILRAPGSRDDWVEILLHPPQGSPDHLCLDVPDIQRAYQALRDRGAALRGKPRIASNGHWVLNLADPNGIRVELMEPHPAPK